MRTYQQKPIMPRNASFLRNGRHWLVVMSCWNPRCQTPDLIFSHFAIQKHHPPETCPIKQLLPPGDFSSQRPGPPGSGVRMCTLATPHPRLLSRERLSPGPWTPSPATQHSGVDLISSSSLPCARNCADLPRSFRAVTSCLYDPGA